MRDHFDLIVVFTSFIATLGCYIFLGEPNQLKDLLFVLGGAIGGVAIPKAVQR